VKKLISAAKKTGDLKVVDDQVGSPTAVSQVSVAILDLLTEKLEGIFHFAADGYVSRFDMAKFVFNILDLKVNLTGCKTADFQSAAKRPLNSRFNCDKIKTLLSRPIEHWQIPLEKFVRLL
jgi:dTDP-4-dehydrorhamnose reductase